MEQSKVDLFIGTMTDKFLPTDIPVIKSQLERLSDDKFSLIQSVDYKNPTTILIFSLFLGAFGIDRFMLGQTLLGILKLITFGGLGIWAIVDWFIIMKKARKVNFDKFMNQVNIIL